MKILRLNMSPGYAPGQYEESYVNGACEVPAGTPIEVVFKKLMPSHKKFSDFKVKPASRHDLAENFSKSDKIKTAFKLDPKSGHGMGYIFFNEGR